MFVTGVLSRNFPLHLLAIITGLVQGAGEKGIHQPWYGAIRVGALHVNMNRGRTAKKFSCENNGGDWTSWVWGFLKFTKHVHDRLKK